MNTGEYANDSFIGQAHRPADPAQKERIKATGATGRETGRKPSSPAIRTTWMCSMPWGHSRPVCALHGSDRAGLVFVTAQCGRERAVTTSVSSNCRPSTRTPSWCWGRTTTSWEACRCSESGGCAGGLSGDKEKGIRYLRKRACQWRNQRGCRHVLMLFLRRSTATRRHCRLQARSPPGFRATIF